MQDGARADASMPSGIELSELDAVYRDAPHDRLDRLRHDAPRYFDPAAEGARLFLTRYADVRAVLADRTLTRDEGATRSRGANAASGTLLAMEGAKHLMGRKLVARALDAQTVEARRAGIVAVVDAHLDAIKSKGSFDGLADYAAPVPLCAIADLLGLPRGDTRQVRAWAVDAGTLTMLPARTAGEDRRLAEAATALQRYVGAAIQARRAAPGDDLISDLLDAEIEGRRLRDEEVLPLCFLVLLAGSLTTTDLIANAIVALLRHPDQLARLRAEPDLIESAIEEVLRYDPPVSAVARHAVEEREVLGCPMRPGGTVKSSLLAANHDPAVFAEPHAFRIDRPNNKHFAFGGGSHGCLGAGLARLEAQIAVQRLFARFPRLRLADPAPPRKTTYGFRGYDSLPLAVK
jgi:cytochrome P450